MFYNLSENTLNSLSIALQVQHDLQCSNSKTQELYYLFDCCSCVRVYLHLNILQLHFSDNSILNIEDKKRKNGKVCAKFEIIQSKKFKG